MAKPAAAATKTLHDAVRCASDPALQQSMEQRVQAETSVEVLQEHLEAALERELFRLQAKHQAMRSKTDVGELRACVLEAIRNDEHKCTAQAMAVRLAIREGADVNDLDEDDRGRTNWTHGRTPLYRAIHEKDIWLMRVLIAAGADVNTAKEYGWTPFYGAILYGGPDAVRVLVAYGGADVNMADEVGETPLHWAADNGQLEAMKVLLAAGANVNSVKLDGETPLHGAASFSLVRAERLLLNTGAVLNPDEKKDGETNLHRAACKVCVELVEVLLEAGADVNQERWPTDGQTPLCLAVAEGIKTVVRVLKQAKSKTGNQQQQGVVASSTRGAGASCSVDSSVAAKERRETRENGGTRDKGRGTRDDEGRGNTRTRENANKRSRSTR